MVVPDTLSAWLKGQIWPIAIIVIVVMAVLILLKISAYRRHAELVRERRGVNEETFVKHLSTYAFDPLITGTTYRYLQQVQHVSFPILPTDHLDNDLGLGEEDVEESLHDLLSSLNRQEAPGLRHLPLVTVEDLVRHLQASPRIHVESMAA